MSTKADDDRAFPREAGTRPVLAVRDWDGLLCWRFANISAHSATSSKARPAAPDKSFSDRWCAGWLRPSTSPTPSSPSSPT